MLVILAFLLRKHELIFISFSQASTSKTCMYVGTGLGLAIIKNLLELGKINTKSEIGKGTSFEFKINYKLS